jgi:predicted glutamine amidotransferase
MCLIVNFKEKDKTRVLKNFDIYFSSNKDGVGLIWINGKNVFWKKGFMNLEDLKSFLKGLNFDEIFVHFRMATSGERSVEMTHPFLISEKRDNLTEGELLENEVLLMENGVTNEIFSVADFLEIERDNKSDTFLISEVFKKLGIFDVEEIKRKLKKIDNSSKFVLVAKQNDEVKIEFLGDWVEENGVRYSNRSGLCEFRQYFLNEFRRDYEISKELEEIISKTKKVRFMDVFAYFNNDFTKVKVEITRDSKKEVTIYKLKKFLKRLYKIANEDVKKEIEILRRKIEEKRKGKEENKRRNWYCGYWW